MAYYRVEGTVINQYIDYIEAKNEKEAIKKAEDVHCTCFDEVLCDKISKKEYEEDK